jgi:voltage-gated potassium channel
MRNRGVQHRVPVFNCEDDSVTTGLWEKWTNWPLMVASLGFLIAYALPIVDPSLAPVVIWACNIATWVTWVLFAFDYVVRLLLAPNHRRYLVKHWFDLLVIALPLLRPLRPLRLVSLLQMLTRHAATGLRGKVAIYVVRGSGLLGLWGRWP